MPEEIEEAREVVKNEPEWREAAAKRGVENFDLVLVDPWSASGFEPEDHEGKRLCRAISWIRTSENDNGRARPIEDLFAFVDFDEMEVVEIEDNGVPDPDSPLPPEDADYRADRVEMRNDYEHLDVVQPDGPSWEVDGNKVEWLDWELRVGWTAREGLVFHDVKFDDGDESRRVLHRASTCEMAVPTAIRIRTTPGRTPSGRRRRCWSARTRPVRTPIPTAVSTGGSPAARPRTPTGAAAATSSSPIPTSRRR